MAERTLYRHPAVREQEGHTLVEMMISMALLLTVLLPSVALLGYLAHYPANEERIIALNEAQSAMEQLIHAVPAAEMEVTDSLRTGWKLHRSVTFEGRRVFLEVRIIRRGRNLMQLNAIRLRNPDE